MAIRVRRDGSMWCAALTKPEEGDVYIDDDLHYHMSVECGVIVALPMPEHKEYCRWWWVNAAPPEADFWAAGYAMRKVRVPDKRRVPDKLVMPGGEMLLG